MIEEPTTLSREAERLLPAVISGKSPIPKVMRCEWCNRYQRTEDLTPDYDLILLCPKCIEKLSSPNESR